MTTTVAWVGDSPIDVSEVDVREGALRTSEGRQLRRWVVQVLVAERLVRLEAEARGLTSDDAPGLVELAPDRATMLGLGSVVADVLTRNPLARAVFVAVTAEVRVSEVDIERFHTANPERFLVAEQRVVRHALDGVDRPLRTLRRGEWTGAVEDAVFAAEVGAVVGPIVDPLGTHTLAVEEVRPARTRSLAECRAEIEAHLVAGARRRAFTAWLDRHAAATVRLAHGYEHPGDPGQPDNTHRH
jgi:[acyl-carrier-protein] S-malonyltransferase